jgi:hypothetical protein
MNMSPRIQYIIASALVLVVCRAAFDQAGAKVVRNDKGAPANPAVEAGGRHLSTAQSLLFPYSLIGAIANDERWIETCGIWPRRSLHNHGFNERKAERPFEDGRFSRFPPLVK